MAASAIWVIRERGPSRATPLCGFEFPELEPLEPEGEAADEVDEVEEEDVAPGLADELADATPVKA